MTNRHARVTTGASTRRDPHATSNARPHAMPRVVPRVVPHTTARELLLAFSCALAALLLLGACTGDREERAPSTRAARDTARRVVHLDSAHWRIEGASAESLFAGAIALTADDSTVYLLASGGRRLVALGARDGAVRWTLPASGGPPLVSRAASALVRTPLGALALLDGPSREIRVVGAEGRARETITLPPDGEPTQVCAREHGGFVVAGGDERGRLVALQPDGAFEWSLVVPFADADSLLALQLQTALASTPDGATCVAALRLGRGFVTLRAIVPPIVAAHAYVEPIAIPAVHTVERRDGPNTFTYTLLDDAPAAAAGVAVTAGTIAVAFEGATRERHRAIDLFALEDGRYVGSLLHATPVVAIAAWGTRLYVLHRARGRFALAAYDAPALRDGVPPGADSRSLAAVTTPPADTTLATRASGAAR